VENARLRAIFLRMGFFSRAMGLAKAKREAAARVIFWRFVAID